MIADACHGGANVGSALACYAAGKSKLSLGVSSAGDQRPVRSPMMLESLQTYARRFYAARQPLLLLILATLAGLALILLFSGSHTQDMLMIPLLLLFIWVTMLFSCINLFAHVPRPANEETGWLSRLGRKLKRSVFYLFALIFLLISVGLVVTTFQLVMVWVRMYVL